MLSQYLQLAPGALLPYGESAISPLSILEQKNGIKLVQSEKGVLKPLDISNRFKITLKDILNASETRKIEFFKNLIEAKRLEYTQVIEKFGSLETLLALMYPYIKSGKISLTLEGQAYFNELDDKAGPNLS